MSDGSNPGTVISKAIHDLVAARLGRSFVPLAGLFLAGLVALAGSRPHGPWVAGGALLTAASTLYYGLAIARPASGGGWSVRAVLTRLSSMVPPIFGVYVIGWPGLKRLASGLGWAGVGSAILYAVLGVWVLRSWLRIIEVRRLAQVMIPTHEVRGDSTR